MGGDGSGWGRKLEREASLCGGGEGEARSEPRLLSDSISKNLTSGVERSG